MFPSLFSYLFIQKSLKMSTSLELLAEETTTSVKSGKQAVRCGLSFRWFGHHRLGSAQPPVTSCGFCLLGSPPVAPKLLGGVWHPCFICSLCAGNSVKSWYLDGFFPWLPPSCTSPLFLCFLRDFGGIGQRRRENG